MSLSDIRSKIDILDGELAIALADTLEALEAVASAVGGLAGDLAEVAGALIDRSLIQRVAGPDGAPRLLLLETVREHGLDAPP